MARICPGTLAELARTCRRMRDAAITALYRDIALSEYGRCSGVRVAFDCCPTLLRCDQARFLHTRRLELWPQDQSDGARPCHALYSDVRLLWLPLLRACRNVREVLVAVYARAHSERFCYSTLQELGSLSDLQLTILSVSYQLKAEEYLAENTKGYGPAVVHDAHLPTVRNLELRHLQKWRPAALVPEDGMPPLALPDSVDACPNLEQWTLVARRPPLRTELAPFPRAVALLKVLDWRATDLYRSPDAFFAHENFLPREVRLATARHWLPACASKPIELLELGRADPEQLLGPLPATLRVLRLVEPRRIVRGLGERVKEALEARRGTRIKVRWCRHDVRFWRSVRNAVVYA